MNLCLDIRVVEQVQEGPHQAGSCRFHASQEQVDQVVEQCIVSYGRFSNSVELLNVTYVRLLVVFIVVVKIIENLIN